MRLFWKILKRFALLIGVLVALLAIALLTAPLWQKKWIEPVPGIRLEPATAWVSEQDIKPDSAFDLLKRACEIQSKIPRPSLDDDFKLHEEWSWLDVDPPWSPERFPHIAEALRVNNEALALVHRAALAERSLIPSYDEARSRTSYITPSIKLCQLLRSSISIQCDEKNYPQALSDLHDLLSTGDIVSRGGAMIQQLVNTADCAMACAALRYLALEQRAPDDFLKNAARELQLYEDELQPWAETLRHEWRGEQRMATLLYERPTASSGIFPEIDKFHFRAWAFGWLLGSTQRNSAHNFESVYSHAIAMAEVPYDCDAAEKFEKPFTGEPSAIKQLTVRDPFGYVLATMIVPTLVSAHIRHLEHLTHLHATQIVLAICRFQNAQHRPPATLQELVPEYLPRVPSDPYNEKPMRYALATNGAWKVYSVGPNKRDDGGAAPEKVLHEPNAPGDLVFPSTEVADYKARLEKLKH